MALKIIDCEQGSDIWFRARMGIPTASEFQCLLARGRSGGESKGRKTYLYKLAGEIISGEPMERYQNGYIDRGHSMEDEARAWYEMTTETEVQRVGFVLHDEFRAGASPDAFIDSNGGLEIKTKAPHLLLDIHETQELPSEHRAQIQGSLWLTGREWWDFVAYFTHMRPFAVRVFRDEPYIAALAVAVKEFNEELDALVRKYK